MLVLGIESSCDETALALVRDGVLVDAVLASQADIHALFGGVVPELASREHLRYMGALFDELMRRQNLSPAAIGCVAVSRGPGLLGSLLVGTAFAKGLALGTGCRIVGVNHLMAHLLACGLGQELSFPAIGLLVSGGHTSLYCFRDEVTAEALGRTIDDAAGEAFDKSGKLLGLSYPGGRLLDELARRGTPDPALFPRPYLDNPSLDFSFSGLKTAAALAARERLAGISWPRPLERAEDAPQELCDLCASFNLAVAETLLAKTRRAFERHPEAATLLLAGGVAANSLVRSTFQRFMAGRGGRLCVPSPALCTDNAAMVAYAGWIYASRGLGHGLDFETVPRGRRVPDDMALTPAEGRAGSAPC